MTSFPLRTYLVILAGFLICIPGRLESVTGGKIAGRIYDVETNEPLPGANVVIEGTSLGTAAGGDGSYFILLPQPGEYIVTASVIGYVQMRATEVLVQVGLTTPLDFALTVTALEGEVVTIIADRTVIQTDVGNSGAILTGSELAAMPAGNFKEILDKQMGIQEVDARGLFIRGQRQNSISLRVDGIETRDNVDELVYTRFNPDEVEQVEINAGGYDAAYGNATGGMINVVTKEGGKKFSGTFDYRLSVPSRKHFGPPLKHYYDEYFLEGYSDSVMWETWKREVDGTTVEYDTLVNTWESMAHDLDEDTPYEAFYDRPELLKELYKYYMRDEAASYGDQSDMVLNATLGGPVPFLENTTFFASFRREKSYYLYPGPLDHFFDQNGMVKLTTRPVKSMKLSFSYRYTETIGLNRYDYYQDEVSDGDLGASEEGQYNPDYQSEKRYIYEGVEQVAWSGYGDWPYTGRMGQSERLRNQYGVTFTHTLSPRTFYELKFLASNYRIYGDQCTLRDTSLRHELIDPADPTYSVILTGPDARAPLDYWPMKLETPIGDAWIMGGTYGYSERNSAKELTFRANVTSQVNKYNLLNLGFEYVTYEIKKREYRDTENRLGKWLWDVNPQSCAFWASDKVEFEGAAITASLRGDVRIPDEWFNWRGHTWDPIWINTDKLVAYDSTGTGPEGAPRYQPPIKTVLAPRLSISHPIGQAAKIYFNWGHYYQEQAFERQYLYYRRDATEVQQIHYGDPELPFRKSVQYEIGYEQNIADVFRVALSGYYKDVKNLLMDRVGYRSLGREDGDDDEYANFYTYGPNRYMSSQGIEARLEKRQGRYVTAWCNFSAQIFSRGVYGFSTFYENPDDDAADPEFDYADENRKRPLESRLNAGLDISTPRGFGPSWLGSHPIGDVSINFLYWWRQQPTFTDNISGLPAPYAPRDNQRWAPHQGVNMNFKKRFHIGGITPVFYVEVYNLFNTKNMWRGAFNEKAGTLRRYLDALEEKGGRPGEDGELAEEIIGNDPTTALPFNGAPWFLYLNPRQVWAGIRFEFN
ncbi:carboxypeptidase regulatory-like domain-containing protein [Candidatus Neomarinimicrobiota bacterium]